jgi:alkylresorcinol/alkylpyrone synthase
VNAPLSSRADAGAVPFVAAEVLLRSLATAVPPHRLDQDRVRAAAKAYLSTRTGLFDHLEPVFTNAEIETRYACESFDWYLSPRDFGEKSRSYADHALSLSLDAGNKAMAAAGVTPQEIDAIVVVSTTGVVTPSLDARLMNLLPFRRETMRLPIFGYGCAGGVLGMTRAAQLAGSRPGTRVLLIVVELCTMAIRHDRISPSTIVATAVVADGAAAAVLESQPAGAVVSGPVLGTIGIGGEHCWADTLDVMGWRVDGGGLDVVFSSSIPQIVADDYPAALEAFLARSGLGHEDFVRPCCHPGGVKVIEALEQVYGLHPGALDIERGVLRDYGNMSAPTVLFVLDRIVQAGIAGPVLLSSLGPGFTAAFQMVRLAGPR